MATMEDIQYHYDLNNDFFKIFLDTEYMQYSCGVWDNTNSLEKAQINKIDRILELANAKNCKNLLDVGCGWGGAVEYALNFFNVKKTKSITLSQEQFLYIKEKKIQRNQVFLQSWEDLTEKNFFDSIISVGAFEHFASQEDRFSNKHIDKYRSFFKKCYEVSTCGSFLGLQTIVSDKLPRSKSELASVKFLLNKVFPGSTIPSLIDIEKSIEGLYTIEQKYLIGEHYSRTLKAWKSRLMNSKSFIVEQYGEDIYDFYIDYFNSSIHGFDNSINNLLQISLRKIS